MRPVISACAALCFTVATLGAQTDAVSKSKADPKGARTVTASGCLAGADANYTLTPTTPAAVRGGVPVATSGVLPSHILTTQRDGVDLASHVGQIVEVSGVMTPAPKSAAKAATPQIAVRSVKMIGATCVPDVQKP
jgi:hypothetical protein